MSEKIRVFLAADSTVQTYSENDAPQAGWGQFVEDYFNDHVEFFNHAIGGRSSKTFIEEGHLDKIAEAMNEGDYLFIQMGHNDSTKIRPERYTEPYQDYKDYLRQYINKAREKKAIPILITPVARLHFVSGEFLTDFGDYCNAMKELAEQETVTVVDLMKRSITYLDTIGYEKAKELFMISVNGTDCTHFTQKGANEIARIVSEGIRDCDINLSDYVLS